MITKMLSVAVKKLNILRTIVCLIFVNMMSYFSRLKISSKFLFKNKPVFSNISLFVAKWMVRLFNSNISVAHNSAAFPKRMIFKLSRCSNFVFCFFAMFLASKSCLPSFKASRMLKSFKSSIPRNISFFVSHIFLQIKRPISSCLEKTEMSLRNTLGQKFIYPSFLSNLIILLFCSFSVIILASCNPAFAQTSDIQKVRVSLFDGGQNSQDFFDKLEVNQGAIVQNADISNKGQANTRKGQSLFLTDVGSTAFSGLGADYIDSTTSYHIVASSTEVDRNGSSDWVKISTSSMGTGFDTGFVQANNLLFVYNGNANTAWWNGSNNTWNAGGSWASGSPPVATTSAWLANYLFLSGNPVNPDWVFFSTNLNPVSFPAANIRKINTGDGQAVKRLVPFRLSELIVYKERSIFDLDISGDPSTTGFTVTSITKDVGTPAPRSVVFLGNDQWFLSSPPYAVRALTRTQFDKILVDIMSRDIQDIFDGSGDRTLNTVHVGKAAAVLYENKYMLAIATGSSSVNDFVVVYDFLTKSWWTIDGWYPKDWLVKDNILYYTDANDGRVVQCFSGTTGDFGTNHSSASGPTTSIAYSYASRGIDFGYPENYKNLDTIGVEFFPTGNYNATISINIDNGGWQTIGSVNLLGNALTLPFTLPATLQSEGLTIKNIQAQAYGKFKKIQVRVTQDETDEITKLQAIDIYARIRPWNRDDQ